MDRKVFTLEEANELVPTLTDVVGKQLQKRQRIETRLKSLAHVIGEVPEDLMPLKTDTREVRSLKEELVLLISEYQIDWGQVEALGAVVKDPRTGLVDFYGQLDGKAVWLCWKYGETEVGHYHALDEGISGRKTIRDTVRKLSLN